MQVTPINGMPAVRLPSAARLSQSAHKELLDGTFWHRIPAYQNVSAEEFADHRFQMKKTITRHADLQAILQGVAPDSFLADVAAGLELAPMSIRISPYLLSLIDWSDPYRDPIRRQFISVASSLRPDHPMLRMDSLGEQADSPRPGLTHRYRDKALFLALDTCPVYCRFCTRSYAIGADTKTVEKVSLKAKQDRWDDAFEYLANNPQVEDVVVSGGDSYNLRADQILYIGNSLLKLPNIRRIRFATKGPAVMPQKVLSDAPWLQALTNVADFGRKQHKEVAVHVHFNHPNEITQATKDAMDAFFERGITVRNQSVLQRGVNDDVDTLRLLTRRLSYCNIHSYYVYVHDLVKGVEDLRTSIHTAAELEKRVRGDTAGFNTPVFVCDAPGGGGKRTIHSYEYYDRTTGIAVYTSPAVKPGYFLYFDPIEELPAEARMRWRNESERRRMVADAVAMARQRVIQSSRPGGIDTRDADGPIHF
jgi:lysine 2,3-aminomutase